MAEAHAVYQFPLPPLVLHAFAAGDATRLRSWLSDVAPPRPDTTFLNFLASHDGVGLRPLEGLDANVNAVAQGHADWLLANDMWGHTGSGGSSPTQRLDANAAN